MGERRLEGGEYKLAKNKNHLIGRKSYVQHW